MARSGQSRLVVALAAALAVLALSFVGCASNGDSLASSGDNGPDSSVDMANKPLSKTVREEEDASSTEEDPATAASESEPESASDESADRDPVAETPTTESLPSQTSEAAQTPQVQPSENPQTAPVATNAVSDPEPSYTYNPSAVPDELVSATGSDINVRALPQHESALVATIGPFTIMYSTGNIGQGYGSDGALHDWYEVTVPNVGVGWVRSDLVTQAQASAAPAASQATRLASGTGDALNLRSDPQHESELIVQVSATTTLLFYGQTGEGYGSDGQLHTWYYVEAPDYGAWGWVRSDLTRAL